jgi:hypothetical protein
MATTPTYATAAGLAGSNYSNVTITGGTGLTYSTATTTATPTWLAEPFYTKQPKVKITDEDIELDGLSLKETMLAVKNELMLPTRLNRNTELEREFAELQETAERYKELERKFLDQKRMWNTLKNTDQ